MTPKPISNDIVKAEAQRLGFSACGLAPAAAVEESHATHLRHWLAAGKHAGMRYMEGHEAMRLDPRLLVEGARTVISVALNYFPAQTVTGISMYATGKDYHEVMRERLHQLMEHIGATGRCFVDTAPVLERYWATRCGIGWIGSNHQLIIPGMGSTFFLGELLIKEEADHYD